MNRTLLTTALIGTGVLTAAASANPLTFTTEVVQDGLNGQDIAFNAVNASGQLGMMYATFVNQTNATLKLRTGVDTYGPAQSFSTSGLWAGGNHQYAPDFTFAGDTPWISYGRQGDGGHYLVVASTTGDAVRVHEDSVPRRGTAIVATDSSTIFAADYRYTSGTSGATTYKSTDGGASFGDGSTFAPSSSSADMAFSRSIVLKSDSAGAYAIYYHAQDGLSGVGFAPESGGGFPNGVWVNRGDVAAGGNHRTRGFDGVRVGSTAYIAFMTGANSNNAAGDGQGTRLWVGTYTQGDELNSNNSIKAENLTRLEFATWEMYHNNDQGGNVSMAALDGTVYLAYRDQVDQSILVTYLDSEGNWADPTTIFQGNMGTLDTEGSTSFFELTALNDTQLALSYIYNSSTNNADEARVAIINAVPEPASLALLGLGGLGLMSRRRRK